MTKKKGENYLNYVPLHNPKHTWDEKNGIVTIHMIHRGFYPLIAQKFFHSPRVSHIDLDVYGSFIWICMDGSRTVGQLAETMKAQFGEKAEPLYDRLVKYMQILRNNEFILFRGRDRVKP